MPLKRPDIGLAGQIHCFDEIVCAAGYLHKDRRQGLDCLMVTTVVVKLHFLQQGSQGCIRQDAYCVGSPVIGWFHRMLNP